MIDKEKLNKFLTDGSFKKEEQTDYSFKGLFSRNVTGLFDKFITPWLVECLTKYSETEFHQKMGGNSYTFKNRLYRGFDFIGDWQVNHKKKIWTFRKTAKIYRDIIIFDEEKYLAKILHVLENVKGWRLQEYEKTCLKHTIRKVYEMIYL